MSTDEDDSNISRLKVVLVGDGFVGKTTLMLTYKKHEFPENPFMAIHENYVIDTTINGKEYAIDLWDTPGQEEFTSLGNKHSLTHVKSNWIPEILHNCGEFKFILVGMKNDLVSKEMRTGKTFVITREKYAIMYEIVINSWIRNCSEKSNKFDVFKNFSKNTSEFNVSKTFPKDLVKIIVKYSENTKSKSEKWFESKSKNYSEITKNNCVKQTQIDEIIKEIKPNDYISCSSLTGDGIDQLFEAVVRLYNLQCVKENKLKKRKKCQIL